MTKSEYDRLFKAYVDIMTMMDNYEECYICDTRPVWRLKEILDEIRLEHVQWEDEYDGEVCEARSGCDSGEHQPDRTSGYGGRVELVSEFSNRLSS